MSIFRLHFFGRLHNNFASVWLDAMECSVIRPLKLKGVIMIQRNLYPLPPETMDVCLIKQWQSLSPLAKLRRPFYNVCNTALRRGGGCLLMFMSELTLQPFLKSFDNRKFHNRSWTKNRKWQEKTKAEIRNGTHSNEWMSAWQTKRRYGEE